MTALLVVVLLLAGGVLLLAVAGGRRRPRGDVYSQTVRALRIDPQNEQQR
jgi:hypothetical protein